MKLSEAIRKGSQLYPKTSLPVYFENVDRKPVGSTALGAAWVGIGRDPSDLLSAGLRKHFRYLRKR